MSFLMPKQPSLPPPPAPPPALDDGSAQRRAEESRVAQTEAMASGRRATMVAGRALAEEDQREKGLLRRSRMASGLLLG